MRHMVFWVAIAAMLGGVTAAWAVSASGPEGLPTIDGIFGLSPVGPTTYLAVYVPLGEGDALGGLKWYNNDSQTVFPKLLVASGAGGAPPAVGEAATVLENVPGLASAWSEVTLPVPQGSDEGGCYLMFQLPAGSVCSGEGVGTGAGIGYTTIGGLPAWVSADGENWVGLQKGFGLAVQPEVAVASKAMVFDQGTDAPPAVSLVTALLPSGPNPFNPKTQLKFSLRKAGPASLVIYNLRGEVVRRLVEQEYPAGEHAATWDGRNGEGRDVASGTYVARFVADGIVMTRRLALVK